MPRGRPWRAAPRIGRPALDRENAFAMEVLLTVRKAGGNQTTTWPDVLAVLLPALGWDVDPSALVERNRKRRQREKIGRGTKALT